MCSYENRLAVLSRGHNASHALSWISTETHRVDWFTEDIQLNTLENKQTRLENVYEGVPM